MSATFSVSDLNTAIDGTPRMMDLTLAEALNFSRPRDIRKIVERHMLSLKRFGEVCATVAQTLKTKDNSGGRPGKAYYLNKKQALYICTKSDTENATEVTIQMVEVFDAYTSGKPVNVREHNRRTSTKLDDAVRLKNNVDRLEAITNAIQPKPAAQTNFCAMVIDGEHVFVDLNDYRMSGERAVVVTWDGKTAIMEAESCLPGPKAFGPRTAWGPRQPAPHGGTLRQAVVVVGKVIEPGTVVKPAVPVGTSYKDQIVPMLHLGIGVREIARRLGCSAQNVSQVKKRMTFE